MLSSPKLVVCTCILMGLTGCTSLVRDFEQSVTEWGERKQGLKTKTDILNERKSAIQHILLVADVKVFEYNSAKSIYEQNTKESLQVGDDILNNAAACLTKRGYGEVEKTVLTTGVSTNSASNYGVLRQSGARLSWIVSHDATALEPICSSGKAQRDDNPTLVERLRYLLNHKTVDARAPERYKLSKLHNAEYNKQWNEEYARWQKEQAAAPWAHQFDTEIDGECVVVIRWVTVEVPAALRAAQFGKRVAIGFASAFISNVGIQVASGGAMWGYVIPGTKIDHSATSVSASLLECDEGLDLWSGTKEYGSVLPASNVEQVFQDLPARP